MLTYAIGFVQDVQLICFAVIFVAMYLQDRSNRSLRWFAAVFVSGFAGAVLHLSAFFLPALLSRGLAAEAPIVSYGCLHACLVEFTGIGRRSRWITVVLIGLTLPCFLFWAEPGLESQFDALLNLTLAIQTATSVWLLSRSTDREALWPQRLMAWFLGLYSLVQWIRVAIFWHNLQLSPAASDSLEAASGILYVIALSVLPLAFIWMINRRLNARLQRESMSDALTGINNRRGLELAGLRELSRYQRFGQGFAVVLVDIDHFKRLNDSFGHATGDIVLKGTAAFLQAMVRESDTIGRIGGEEFVILLPGTELRAAEQTIDRIRMEIENHFFVSGDRSVRITASFGIAHSLGRTGITWERMLQEADVALYTAKRDGRNCIRIYTDPSAARRRGPYSSTYSMRAAG
jgi:diguanylate cyclase (GGDEF)-like protein